MNNINEVRIKNYKSIEHIVLQDCKRYNLLIGRPNVGKSNILEAMSLYQVPFFKEWNVNFNDVFRIDNASSLFYLGEVDDKIEISADNVKLTLSYRNQKNIDIELSGVEDSEAYRLVNLKPEEVPVGNPLTRTYRYTSLIEHDDEVDTSFLCPYTGSNLSRLIKSDRTLYDYISELLKTDSLSLVFDTGKQEYVVMKKTNDDRSLILPFKAVADSLLRLIYYKTAVLTNKDAVLIMEEPEAHTYPPYISRMVHDVLECKDNQFFIATHSPYVVNEFLQEMADVAIYIVDAEEGKTTVKRLSDDELAEVYDFGIDLFFNTESFIK